MSWKDIQGLAARSGVSARIVAMESIQVHLLDALFSQPESTQVAFQGGTCLRLVYGGYRYSEDIDLVSTAVR